MESLIKKIFRQDDFPLKIDLNSLVITKLEGGKASDVFKVSDINGISLAVKIPKTDWQRREIHVYRDYLSKTHIDAPRYIYEHNNSVLFIEWIVNYKTVEKMSLSNLITLKDWIVNKYKESLSLFKNEKVDLSKHISWMIEEPVKRLIKNADIDLNVKKALVKNKPELIKIIENIGLPMVLDHSDLEIQNLLFNKDSSSLCVIDWANAIKSPGFFDIAQYRKLAREHTSTQANKLIHDLLEEVGLDENKHIYLLNVFAYLKEIMLLDYYLIKNKNSFLKEIAYSKKVISYERLDYK